MNGSRSARVVRFLFVLSWVAVNYVAISTLAVYVQEDNIVRLLSSVRHSQHQRRRARVWASL